MKFKIGDRVKIISQCKHCQYGFSCGSCNGTNEGIILRKNYCEGHWDIQLSNGFCHFCEEQLELIPEETEVFGIVKFCREQYNTENR